MSTLIETGSTAGAPISSSPSTPRNLVIDCGKGLGILCIALMHNGPFNIAFPPLASMLFSCVVAFFFFLSGVTFSVNNQTFTEILKKKTDSLLKPCLVVLLFIGLAKIAVGKAGAGTLLLSMTYLSGFVIPWPPLWFLPHLWLIMLVCGALLIRWKRYFTPTAFMLLTFIALQVAGYYLINSFDSLDQNPQCSKQTSFYLDLFRCGLPFSADLLPLSASFFLAGYVLSAHIKRFTPNTAFSAIAFVLLVGLAIYYPQKSDLNSRVYPYIFAGVAKAVLGIYLLLAASYVISRLQQLCALLVYCGKASLIILLFHSPILFFITNNMFRFTDSRLLVGLTAFCVPIGASLVIYAASLRFRFLQVLLLPAAAKHNVQFAVTK